MPGAPPWNGLLIFRCRGSPGTHAAEVLQPRQEWQALDMGRQVKVKALGDGLTATSDSVGRYKVRPGIVTSTAGG